MPREDFTLVYAFNPRYGVLLVRKGRDSARGWMVGKLNGLGGKVDMRDIAMDTDASFRRCAAREFTEESGVEVTAEGLRYVMDFGGKQKDYWVKVFALMLSDDLAASVVSETRGDEQLYWVPVMDVLMNEEPPHLCGSPFMGDVAHHVEECLGALGSQAWRCKPDSVMVVEVRTDPDSIAEFVRLAKERMLKEVMLVEVPINAIMKKP